MGRDKTEQAVKEVFKPVVTPSEKLVATSNLMKREIKDEPTDIIPKDEIDENMQQLSPLKKQHENETINQFESDTIPFENSPLKQHENNSTIYLKKLFSNNKGLDTTFGVRKLKDNRLMMGDSSIEFKDNMI
ncbi:hypothetical protein PV326_002087, partial [Microctonus aethiopoides]